MGARRAGGKRKAVPEDDAGLGLFDQPAPPATQAPAATDAKVMRKTPTRSVLRMNPKTDPVDAEAKPSAGESFRPDEPLCMTLLLREADETPQGAENLRKYLESQSRPRQPGG